MHLPLSSFKLLVVVAAYGLYQMATSNPPSPATAVSSETSAPTFTHADVHPSPWINYLYMNGGTLQGERYTLRQATMVDLISTAYSVDPAMIHGGPSWVEFDRFDIVAQAPRGTPAATLKLMLRSLLTERFGLVTHEGTALIPTWLLTAVKPKLAQAQAGRTQCIPERPSGAGTLMVAVACRNMPMDQFAQILQKFGGNYFDNKPVVDSTGLDSRYDFEFQWTPRGLLARSGSDGVSIFDAMERQLGLKLDLGTAPRSVLTIDEVNRIPTPNAPGIEEALPPEPPAHFEVAVIRPSRDDEQFGGSVGRDRIDFQANSLKYLIQFAWNLNLDDDEDLVGLPKWGISDRYDVLAKASSEDLVQSARGNQQIEYEQARNMLRALLIERFGIQAHMEERPIFAYNFEAADPKLKLSNPSERTKCEEGPIPGGRDPRSVSPMLNRLLHCQNVTLTEFGRVLPFFAPGYIYSPVLDETGLKGRYDFTLTFSSADRVQLGSGNGNVNSVDSNGGSQSLSLVPHDPNGAISLYKAVRHQLGLRLQKVRRPGLTLVIDKINRRPSAN